MKALSPMTRILFSGAPNTRLPTLEHTTMLVMRSPGCWM